MSTQTDMLKDNAKEPEHIGGVGNVADFNKKLNEESIENTALSEFLSRKPKENIELLDAESSVSKIYGYAYITGDMRMRDVPGMNKVEFEIPNDPHKGKYIGYESYEDTYKKAKSEYESAIINNKADSDVIKKYQDATSVYDAKRIEYENYLYKNPDCPDYLKDNINPAKAYANYIEPKEKRMALDKKEASEITKDVSMKEIEDKMKDSDKFTVTSASEYKSPTSEKPMEYVVQMAGTLSNDTVNSMSKYAESKNIYLPEITADKDTDEYGVQVLSQMKEIDKLLSKSNSEYSSVLPENTKYYKDGENPKAVPGMTMIVGRIEGAPGYYVGYESYDKTYSRSLSEYQKEQQAVYSDYEKDNDMTKFNSKSEELSNKYQEINSTYDMQKEQYDSYKKENPSNNYLSQPDALMAFENYDKSSPFLKKFQNGFVDIWNKIQDICKNIGDTMRMYTLKQQGIDTNAIYSEEQVLAKSGEYWQERAKLNHDDKNIQMASARYSKDAAKAGTQPSSYSAVLSGIEVDKNYEYKTLQNTGSQKQSKTRLSTGNDMLDSLNYGNPDASINQLVSQLPDDKLINTNATYSLKPIGKTIEMDKTNEMNKTDVRRLPGQTVKEAEMSSKGVSTNMKSSRAEGIAALEERLRVASEREADFSK